MFLFLSDLFFLFSNVVCKFLNAVVTVLLFFVVDDLYLSCFLFVLFVLKCREYVLECSRMWLSLLEMF